MGRRFDVEVSEEDNSLSYVLALAYGVLLASLAMVVSLNVVEVGLYVVGVIF